jgi:hypothetical protein
MAAEFEERGTSFVVRSTVDELVRDLEPSSYDWQRFAHDLGHDVDRGPEHDR